MKNKTKYILGIILTIIIGGIVGISQVTLGSQSTFPDNSNCQSSSATTTRNWMTPGTATTTLQCDAYTLSTTLPKGTAIDSMALAVQLTSSTTQLSRLVNIAFDYSKDNVDWYPLGTIQTTVLEGMTIFQVASSTLNYQWQPSDTSASTTMTVIPLPDVPTRYIRARFSIPIGSSNGAVWAEFIPKKQQ